MKELPSVEELHSRVATLLSVPSIDSYSQALREIEEIAEAASSFEHCTSPAIVPLLYYTERYKMICVASIRELAAQASIYEYEMHDGAANDRVETKPKRGGLVENIVTALVALRLDDGYKRQGVVFDVDEGEHIAAALEALHLEDFVEERANEDTKHGHSAAQLIQLEN
ncbi:hypothetical protein F5Y01DRAFT_201667 [Xylaria sp. FL0043]|nr:hypothetical protein F5Y01DRAFT_201667 [Xylaria sp. FL0043]